MTRQNLWLTFVISISIFYFCENNKKEFDNTAFGAHSIAINVLKNEGFTSASLLQIKSYVNSNENTGNIQVIGWRCFYNSKGKKFFVDVFENGQVEWEEISQDIFNYEIGNPQSIDLNIWRINSSKLDSICEEVGAEKNPFPEYILSVDKKNKKLIWTVPYRVQDNRIIYVDAFSGEVLIHEMNKTELVKYIIKQSNYNISDNLLASIKFLKNNDKFRHSLITEQSKNQPYPLQLRDKFGIDMFELKIACTMAFRIELSKYSQDAEKVGAIGFTIDPNRMQSTDFKKYLMAKGDSFDDLFLSMEIINEIEKLLSIE